MLWLYALMVPVKASSLVPTATAHIQYLSESQINALTVADDVLVVSFKVLDRHPDLLAEVRTDS
jgi:hypothetical protein